jgi:hypothetical protein
MTWLGSPVEFLISELQHLDEQGKGLWDAVVENDMNPLVRFRRQLTKLVSEGADGPMSPLFHGLSVKRQNELLSEVRTMGLDLGAQVDLITRCSVYCWRDRRACTVSHARGGHRCEVVLALCPSLFVHACSSTSLPAMFLPIARRSPSGQVI